LNYYGYLKLLAYWFILAKGGHEAIKNTKLSRHETNMFAKNRNTDENSEHGVPSNHKLKIIYG